MGTALLEVGKVARAHGLDGEVVVDLVTDRTERVEPGSVLYGPFGRRLVVDRSRPFGRRWLVRFVGVGDGRAAEELRGAVLMAEPIDEPGTLWVHELIGALVVDVHGRAHGRVAAVEANPASDLLVLEGGGLVPAAFVVRMEEGEGTGERVVVVDVPEGLLEGETP